MTGPLPVVRRRAELLGDVGERWLAGLPELLDRLAQQWRLTVGDVLTGGTAGHVVAAVRDDGTDVVVVKVGLPQPATGREIDVLVLAAGRGFVPLLEHDRDGGAVLMPRLGPTLADSARTPQQQAAALAALLPEVWALPAGRLPALTSPDKAAELAGMIRTDWVALGEPCPPAVVERALGCADRLVDRVVRPVVLHGDPAPPNALLTGTGAVVLIDPEPFLGPPAYDLGVVLRGWCEELLAGGPGLAVELCGELAEGAGVPPAEVWAWGYLERVATGLHATSLGAGDLGRPFLASAELLLDLGDTPVGR